MSAFKENEPVSDDYPIRLHLNNNNFFFPAHYHKALEVIYVVKGSVTLEVDQRKYELHEKDLFIIGSNHIHGYHYDHTDENAYYLLIFDWNHLESIYKDKELFSQLSPILLNSHYHKDMPAFEPMFSKMVKELNQKAIGYKLSVMSTLYEFLIESARLGLNNMENSQSSKQIKKDHEFVTRVNNYIYQHFSEEIPAKTIAALTGYSEYHFSRRFKLLLGTTYKRYLIHFRINMVKQDLYDDTMTITETAFKNGFSSIKTFNRCFKEVTGTTPRAFKKAIYDQFRADSDK